MSVILAQEGLKFSIFFKFHQKIVDLIKLIPKRTFNDELKYWQIPMEELNTLTSLFKENDISFTIQKGPVDIEQFKPKYIRIKMKEMTFVIVKPDKALLEEFRGFVRIDKPGMLEFNYAELLYVLSSCKKLGFNISI